MKVRDGVGPGGVVVVGAGVVGLSVAVRLLERGARVEIWTADAPQATTSAVAAAVWFPYRAEPRDRVVAWSARTRAVLAELAADPSTGIRVRDGVELLRAAPVDGPWWAHAVGGVVPAAAADLPDGYAAGWVFRAPVVEMPVYLAWLTARVKALGGRLVRRRLDDLEPARAAAGTVVCCAGIGARDLVPDAAVRPVRGQIVRVTNPGVRRFLLDEAGPTYIVPRRDDCVLGGTAEEGAHDLDPDPAVAEAIIARCAALDPMVAGARVLEHRVGLRPARPAVRVERDTDGVVHCYGHGGAGVTLSWGTAEDAVRLVACDHG
ncbi:MAG: NAD(P)/FAD-dependent oxidoreductase [Egibacteraceae bacterium]